MLEDIPEKIPLKNYTRELKKRSKLGSDKWHRGAVLWTRGDRVEREGGRQQHDTKRQAWNPKLGRSWLEAGHARTPQCYSNVAFTSGQWHEHRLMGTAVSSPSLCQGSKNWPLNQIVKGHQSSKGDIEKESGKQTMQILVSVNGHRVSYTC